MAKLKISGNASAIKLALNAAVDKIDMVEIGEIIANEVQRGFDTSTDTNGTRWQPLKRPRPLGRNQNNKPLIDTGNLRASIGYKQTGKLSVRIYTNVEYASVHQNGTIKVPARPFFPERELPKGWALAIKKVFE